MWEKIKSNLVWIIGAVGIIAALFFQRNKIKELQTQNATNQNTVNNAVLNTRIEDSNAALADAKKKLEEEKQQPITDAELLERLNKL